MANTTEKFTDVGNLLRTECPKEPVYCIFPHVYREIAREFLIGFPGRVLYAVKANSDPRVLGLGIRASASNHHNFLRVRCETCH